MRKVHIVFSLVLLASVGVGLLIFRESQRCGLSVGLKPCRRYSRTEQIFVASITNTTRHIFSLQWGMIQWRCKDGRIDSMWDHIRKEVPMSPKSLLLEPGASINIEALVPLDAEQARVSITYRKQSLLSRWTWSTLEKLRLDTSPRLVKAVRTLLSGMPTERNFCGPWVDNRAK
jgi:hypothetical protein